MCNLKRVNLQEWTNATSLAKAFSLGKLESEAIFNLRLRVPAAVLKVLTEAVKQRGLAKLLTHDVIARDCFNQNFSSGVNAMQQWKEELRNRDGNELAARMDSVILPFEFEYVFAHVFRQCQLQEQLCLKKHACPEAVNVNSCFCSGPAFCAALAQ
jgi:hypothetical protein